MMVLRYQNKPYLAFKPRLTLEKTGYCPSGQWCGRFFKPTISVGLSTIHEMNVTQAVTYYLSELKRCGHVPVRAISHSERGKV
jgi:hypothetical protein